jgi:hypothetical protein
MSTVPSPIPWLQPLVGGTPDLPNSQKTKELSALCSDLLDTLVSAVVVTHFATLASSLLLKASSSFDNLTVIVVVSILVFIRGVYFASLFIALPSRPVVFVLILLQPGVKQKNPMQLNGS